MKKMQVRRSAIQKFFIGGKLTVRHLASMGEIMGTLRISRLFDLRKYKSVRRLLKTLSPQPLRRDFPSASASIYA